MQRATLIAIISTAMALSFVGTTTCHAGMPSPLPTYWTADHASDLPGYDRSALNAQACCQAISFFTMGLLLSAWGVKWLWNTLRRDFTALPPLTYLRAVSFVVLWGLLFVIVLTMISGARELMTPGAWRKQGWTYKLADSAPQSKDEPQIRKEQLEKLRFALWQYAAAHEGKFPPENKPSIAADLWQIPGWPGLRFLYLAGRKAQSGSQILVFEPTLGSGDRLALLTNGMVGTMPSTEIDKLVSGDKAP